MRFDCFQVRIAVRSGNCLLSSIMKLRLLFLKTNTHVQCVFKWKEKSIEKRNYIYDEFKRIYPILSYVPRKRGKSLNEKTTNSFFGILIHIYYRNFEFWFKIKFNLIWLNWIQSKSYVYVSDERDFEMLSTTYINFCSVQSLIICMNLLITDGKEFKSPVWRLRAIARFINTTLTSIIMI